MERPESPLASGGPHTAMRHLGANKTRARHMRSGDTAREGPSAEARRALAGCTRSARERAVEQVEERGEVTLARLLVIHRRVGHRVAMAGPGVDLGAVSDSGVVERRIEGGDLLGAVARVLVGVTEVRLGAQGADRAVRALRVLADQAAAVKASECRNPVGMRRSDPPA